MPHTFVDIDYPLNYNEIKVLQPLQDSESFLNSFFYVLIFFVLPNNCMVSGVC